MRIGRMFSKDTVRSPSERHGHGGFVTLTPTFVLSYDGHTVKSLVMSVTAARERHGMPVRDSGGNANESYLLLRLLLNGSKKHTFSLGQHDRTPIAVLFGERNEEGKKKEDKEEDECNRIGSHRTTCTHLSHSLSLHSTASYVL
jgi:hypothetical protein